MGDRAQGRLTSIKDKMIKAPAGVIMIHKAQLQKLDILVAMLAGIKHYSSHYSSQRLLSLRMLKGRPSGRMWDTIVMR
jgi:hypothetical protein